MSDVVKFTDWKNLQSIITEGNQYVSGLSAAEAATALGAKANSGIYTYQAATAAGASNVINFPNAATAAEAAAEYVAGGGSVSGAGAATAATGAAENVANMTIIKGGAEGASGVAGLLAMPLPTAAAAIAPLAGVALGAGLYSLAPDAWEKISKTLLPFCYEDSELLPATVDANGNTYYSKSAIDAFKELAQTENWLSGGASFPDYTGVTKIKITKLISPTDFISYIFGNSFYEKSYINTLSLINEYYTQGYTVIGVHMGTGVGADGITRTMCSNIHFAKPEDKEYNVNQYSGNPPFYYTPLEQFPDRVIFTSSSYPDFTWTRVDRNQSTQFRLTPVVTPYSMTVSNINGSTVPKGITQWEGDTYPETAEPINVLTGYDEEGNPVYTPYYPATTPIGDPGVSTDPSVNPDPTVNPNPAPAIEPYIPPSPDPSKYPQSVPPSNPAPLPNPVPSAQPVPDPSADPSQETENPPDDPTDPKPPTDGGESGTTIIPSIPTLPSAATGLLHVYNPTQAQIDQFGSWLWTTFSGDLIDTLSKLFNDPMDAVIGLHELYATPSTQGDATIRAGYLDSGVSAKLVGNRYTTINCGSVVVEEYYQNYLDYSPYTQVYIYLPFIGIVPVSADDIIGNAVNITYHVDSYTGSCIAVISVAKEGYSSTVYQFQGNCAVEIPISSGYQSSLMAGLLGVAGTAISGSPAVGLTAAHIGRAGLGKNAVSHSGSFGSSYGAMGCKIPYIIVRRPVQKKVADYSKSYGYPAHKMVYIGNCKGYLRAKEVRVTSTKATNVEKEMIVSALKSGVYVK